MHRSASSVPDALQQALKPMREEIDAIDREILALLNRRMQQVFRVGHVKQAHGLASFIRPERETAMLRDIVQRQQQADFPAAAAAQLWRLMITASLNAEKPLRIVVSAPAGDLARLVLARDYFGAFVSMETVESDAIALQQLAEEQASIAVVAPLEPEAEARWRGQQLQIFVHLPAPELAALPPALAGTQAVALAKFAD